MADQIETERQQLHQHWQQRLERARYEVQRAARQYHAVEPENRLVARTLEQRWEQALADEVALQAEYARFQAQQPARLSTQEQAAIRQLAEDIPTLWHAPSTTDADRQAIIRQWVERVIVTVQGETEKCGTASPLDRWVWHPHHAQSSRRSARTTELLSPAAATGCTVAPPEVQGSCDCCRA